MIRTLSKAIDELIRTAIDHLVLHRRAQADLYLAEAWSANYEPEDR